MANPNLSSVPRINITKNIQVTPTITASSAYASGNQIGGIMTLTDVLRQYTNAPGVSQAELHSVTILDGSKQDAAIDIWFFNQSPTVTSTNKTAFAMTAANHQAQCIGAISVGASYSDAAAVSTSTDGVNLSKNFYVPSTAATPTNLYAIAIVRGTPTYTSTTSLSFLFNFYVD